jgi:hypothetical protein
VCRDRETVRSRPNDADARLNGGSQDKFLSFGAFATVQSPLVSLKINSVKLRKKIPRLKAEATVQSAEPKTVFGTGRAKTRNARQLVSSPSILHIRSFFLQLGLELTGFFLRLS